jgi:hypothetical protein
MLERPLPNGLFKYRFGASVGGREGFEGIGIGCLYRNETPPHQHDLALTILWTRSDDRLKGRRRNVVIRRQMNIRCPLGNVEGLRNFLFVRLPVVAATHDFTLAYRLRCS